MFLHPEKYIFSGNYMEIMVQSITGANSKLLFPFVGRSAVMCGSSWRNTRWVFQKVLVDHQKGEDFFSFFLLEIFDKKCPLAFVFWRGGSTRTCLSPSTIESSPEQSKSFLCKCNNFCIYHIVFVNATISASTSPKRRKFPCTILFEFFLHVHESRRLSRDRRHNCLLIYCHF